jgi:hypothetical protein
VPDDDAMARIKGSLFLAAVPYPRSALHQRIVWRTVTVNSCGKSGSGAALRVGRPGVHVHQQKKPFPK